MPPARICTRQSPLGKTLNSGEFKWYRSDDAGQEVEYFNTTLEKVKVVKVAPKMHDIKDPSKKKHNHLELTWVSPGKTESELRERDKETYQKGREGQTEEHVWSYTGVCYADHVLGE